MTKNEIKAKLQIMVNLQEQIHKIGSSIIDTLAPNFEDDIIDVVNEFCSGDRTDVEENMIMFEENGYFKDAKITEEGEPVPVAKIEVITPHDVEVKGPFGDGEICASFYVNDLGPTAGLMYYTAENSPLDIAYVEQHKNESKDLTAYFYADIHTEDYTSKIVFKNDEIKEALGDVSA